jgi:6-carboxyhexanoate--CoA ligase
MRAAAGASHEAGGRHLSGAERLVGEAEVDGIVLQLLERARSRGIPPDFVRVTIERVAGEAVEPIPCLPVSTVVPEGVEQARYLAARLLRGAGVEEAAIRAALEGLRDGWLDKAGLRGAVVLDLVSGRRLDPEIARGVRVSRFDYAPPARVELEAELERQGLSHFRVREALAIASKVVWAGVAAELCWSDEPDYTTGYVATPRHGYVRLPDSKPAGTVGGRVFFVADGGTDISRLLERLEQRATLIEGPVVIRPPVPGSDFR